MHQHKWLGVALSLSLFAGVASAQKKEANKHEDAVYTDPAKAGPDFADQGEYVAEGKWGVQVIADGDGEFEPVVLKGGLPGAGWDGTSRVELKAKREGDKVVIAAGQGFEGSFTGGSMSLKTPDGQVTLKRVVRESARAGAKAPEGATILFDGKGVDAFDDKAEMTPEHLLMCGTKTKQKYQDFTLHVEYLIPFKPYARDQERGNSGIYIQDRYETQILDTFGHKPEFNGSGSMYRQHAPILNMCYPPLQWQTYDIEFHAAKFEGDKKVKDAEVTLNQNGVIVQDHYSLTKQTGAGAKEGPAAGPIQFQGHHNPVVYRNVWIVAK